MITVTRPRSGKRPPPRTQPASAFHLVLKQERDEREWTQRRMGEHLGVSQSTIARWERAGRRPSTLELERVGHLIDVVFIVS